MFLTFRPISLEEFDLVCVTVAVSMCRDIKALGDDVYSARMRSISLIKLKEFFRNDKNTYLNSVHNSFKYN